MCQPGIGVDDGRADAFTGGVVLDDHRSPPLDHLLLDLNRTGGGGVNRELHGTGVVALPHLFRQLEHAHEHYRDPLAVSNAMLLDKGERALRVEALHDDGGAALIDIHHVIVQRRSVVQRCR